jgi:hypothetical protein
MVSDRRCTFGKKGRPYPRANEHPAEPNPTTSICRSVLAWVVHCSRRRAGRSSRRPQKTMLVLYGERLSIPAMRPTEAGLSAGLSSGHGWDPEGFSEYLDLARFPTAQYGDDLVRHLRAKYGTRKPDVLIAVANPVLQFALEHRDELFPGVPIVFADVDHRDVEGKKLPPDVTGLWMAWDYQRTLELALQLQPETREIVCVGGSGTEEQP